MARDTSPGLVLSKMPPWTPSITSVCGARCRKQGTGLKKAWARTAAAVGGARCGAASKAEGPSAADHCQQLLEALEAGGEAVAHQGYCPRARSGTVNVAQLTGREERHVEVRSA